MFYIYNTSIANSNAENLGGGLYAEGDMIHDNLTFINNNILNEGQTNFKKEEQKC